MLRSAQGKKYLKNYNIISSLNVFGKFYASRSCCLAYQKTVMFIYNIFPDGGFMAETFRIVFIFFESLHESEFKLYKFILAL